MRTVAIERIDIAGRTAERESQYATSFKIIPTPGNQRPISIDMYVRFDDGFRSWFADIPVLGAWSADDMRAAALADPAWGASPTERRSRMARASSTARVISIAGYAIALWGFFVPKPYVFSVLVLAATPLSLYVWTLACHGRWALRSAKEDFRPQVGDAIAMPALALAVRSLADLHISDTAVLLGLCGAVSVGAAAAAYSLARSGPNPRWTVVLVLIIAAAWSYGAVGESDVLLDHGSAISTHQLPVIRKDVSRGRSTTYSLVTPPWNGRKNEASIDVPKLLWNSLSIGDNVCIADHAGALRLRWYAVGRCVSSTMIPTASHQAMGKALVTTD